MLLPTIKRAILCFSVFVVCISVAMAQTTHEVLKTKLESAFPGISIDSITSTAVPGLYEVTSGTVIFYSNADGSHILHGDMLAVKNKELTNLTEEKRKQARVKIVNDLSPETLIVYPAKVQRYQLTVFTDTDCGYCRRFHKDIAELNRMGVTVRYVAFPREGKDSATYQKMASIWCSPDRAKAMTDVKSGSSIAAAACKHPLDEHLRVVEALELKGTPTMVLLDGTVIPGYLPPAALLEQLKKVNTDIRKPD